MKKVFLLLVLVVFSLNSFSQKRLIIIKDGGKFVAHNNKLTFGYTKVILNKNKGEVIARGDGEGVFPPEALVINKKYYKLYLTGEKIIKEHLKKRITSYDTIINGYRYEWKNAKLIKKGNKTDTNYKLKITKT